MGKLIALDQGTFAVPKLYRCNKCGHEDEQLAESFCNKCFEDFIKLHVGDMEKVEEDE